MIHTPCTPVMCIEFFFTLFASGIWLYFQRLFIDGINVHNYPTVPGLPRLHSHTH